MQRRSIRVTTAYAQWLLRVSHPFDSSPLPFKSNRSLIYEIKISLRPLLRPCLLIKRSIVFQSSVTGLVLLMKQRAVPYESIFFKCLALKKKPDTSYLLLVGNCNFSFPFFLFIFFFFLLKNWMSEFIWTKARVFYGKFQQLKIFASDL